MSSLRMMLLRCVSAVLVLKFNRQGYFLRTFSLGQKLNDFAFPWSQLGQLRDLSARPIDPFVQKAGQHHIVHPGVKNMRSRCSASTAETRFAPASDFKTKPRAPASRAPELPDLNP